jgi:hypothetical protein
MLKTNLFSFDRKGRLTIFAESISYDLLLRIIRMCVCHARRKKIKKPSQFRFLPTLTELA